LAPEIRVSVGGFDLSLLEGASKLVLSPGISPHEPIVKQARARGIAVLGDIELFARKALAPIAAITGTNGKSTVTTLVAKMAQSSGRRTLAGGNLGTPALELLWEPAPDLYVLELSSFQLETTSSLRTAAAAVLNVTPDHMDRYSTVAEYACAKAKIFDRCATAIINNDDASVRVMPRPAQRTLAFSLRQSRGVDYCAEQEGRDLIIKCRGERLLAMSELKINGAHNAANVMAALAMGEALELPREACLQALREFPGLPHRSQCVGEVAGVRYIDDSKGTNVGATQAAVAGLRGPLVLIAGGQGKGQDFGPLATALKEKVRHAVLIGQDARLIADALAGACSTEFAPSIEQAVTLAASAAKAGDTVLLSPACASLDMFRDYAHRGDCFAAAVRSLQS
jgi:UDP-N-acetylmuramoylalanine--D-glutamate ligase